MENVENKKSDGGMLKFVLIIVSIVAVLIIIKMVIG